MSRAPRFLCDAMLGSLARWLRFFGYDTAFAAPHLEDAEVVVRARQERRWLLTRDRPLAATGPRTILIRSGRLDDQLVEVMGRLGLRADPMLELSRCSVCNGRLRPARADDVAPRIPPYVRATARRFVRCPDCGRVFWPGTHGRRIRDRLRRVTERLEAGAGYHPVMTDDAPPRRTDQLEQAIGHRFAHPELLEEALRHGSAAGSDTSYQRLEFLGDAVLGAVSARLLFERFPHDDEGLLTRKRMHLVRSSSIAARAVELGLDGWVEVGPSEERSQGRRRTALLEDVYEAVVGALLLDGGWSAAERFLADQLEPEIDELDERVLVLANAKSALQEAAQARGLPLPEYLQLRVGGEPHRRNYVYAVTWNGDEIARGEGPSKRDAQQQAARRALARLGLVPDGD
jgi:ribonuclease-3